MKRNFYISTFIKSVNSILVLIAASRTHLIHESLESSIEDAVESFVDDCLTDLPRTKDKVDVYLFTILRVCTKQLSCNNIIRLDIERRYRQRYILAWMDGIIKLQVKKV